jgi:hypothetical protein
MSKNGPRRAPKRSWKRALTSWRKRHSGATHKTKADLEAEWAAEREAERKGKR